jgi:hypothetical protein
MWKTSHPAVLMAAALKCGLYAVSGGVQRQVNAIYFIQSPLLSAEPHYSTN